MPICTYCGGGVPPGKPACPHCGSDAETGWKPEEPSDGIALPEAMDDDDYGDFLADEGLGPPRPDGRHGSWSYQVALVLVLVGAASLVGLLWMLF
ncbi:MAG: hypothetical protein V3T86_08285 [Planctomycetota bacterium]